MEEIDVRHIQVLEFPKLLLWTDRDLEYFLEEMPTENRRMNNDVYDAFIKETEPGKGYQPEEAFNLAYYECVRISLAKYPESMDIFDMLEMDIQHNQSHVNYGYTNMIMNMVWAMLYSTNTAPRFTDKLHSYLVNKRLLKYSFRRFFTPNDFEHIVYPYDEKKEPKYNIQFTPCPDDSRLNPLAGDWGKLTVGYKQHLIGELLMLWPKDKRDNIRQCIMDERDKQVKNFNEFTKKSIIEIMDEPESHLHININNIPADNREKDKGQLLQQIMNLKSKVNQLSRENAELKGKLSIALFEAEKLKEENNIFQKNLGTPQIVLTNNSNFARVVQAMVSARYFKRANGDETNATEVGGLLLKIFGVTNTWKSVLQKAYSRENPLKTFDDLRTAAEKYWSDRFGLTKEIRKKGKK